MSSEVEAARLRLAVDQALYFLAGQQGARAATVARLIDENSLLPEAAGVGVNRIYHVLRNGSQTRYEKTGSGAFRWRVGAEAPPPLQAAKGPLLDQIEVLVADDLEDLVGGLLHACGFGDVRFSTPLASQPDGGVDLRAALQIPLRGRIEFIVAVTGTRLSYKRLADFRGRCRHDEQAVCVAHHVPPSVLEMAQHPSYGKRVTCVDSAHLAVEIERRDLLVDQLLVTGRQLRGAQHG